MTDVGQKIVERLAETMDAESFARMFSPDGTARQQTWSCPDGWLVSYTTEPVRWSAGGRYDGKFVVMAYKPVGKGARSGRGKASRWVRVYIRAYTKRKTARARAEAIYTQHSPKS